MNGPCQSSCFVLIPLLENGAKKTQLYKFTCSTSSFLCTVNKKSIGGKWHGHTHVGASVIFCDDSSAIWGGHGTFRGNFKLPQNLILSAYKSFIYLLMTFFSTESKTINANTHFGGTIAEIRFIFYVQEFFQQIFSAFPLSNHMHQT